jgi:ChrB-like protein
MADHGELDAAAGSWLLLTVSTAGAPDSLRVQVWRRLRSLGALYLHQSVCLLPDRPETARALGRLLDRVRHGGGSGRLLHVALTGPGEEAAITAEFQRERAAEYQELLDRLPELSRELAAERAKGRVTYAEVEESEADLARFQRWLAKISGRDYFGCPLGDQARNAVDGCAQDLARFEAEAFSADTRAPAGPGPGGRVSRLRLAGEA